MRGLGRFEAYVQGKREEGCRTLRFEVCQKDQRHDAKVCFPPVYIQASIADTYSFFGTQEGDFSLSIASICAVKKTAEGTFSPYRDDPNEEVPRSINEKLELTSKTQQGWFGWSFGSCVVS